MNGNFTDNTIKCHDLNSSVKKEIEAYLKNNLSEKRIIHTYNVAEEAKKLAIKWDSDTSKAEIAALCHDLMRRSEPGNNLTHGKTAANFIEKAFDITDCDIINAVRYHTTGRENMSKLEKVIYMADAIEPGRRYPNIEKLRELAYIDLEKACLSALQSTMHYVLGHGLELDNLTALAAKDIENKIESRGM